MKSQKVLIVSTIREFRSAHLYQKLKAAQLEVCAAGIDAHVLRSVAEEFYALRHLNARADLKQAIKQSKAGFIIPSDDRACRYLHKIFQDTANSHEKNIAATIEHSLGDPRYYQVTLDKGELAKTARQIDILIPKTSIGVHPEQYESLGLTFPHLLKKPTGTCGGDGIRIINSRAEAEDAWNALNEKPSLKQLIFGFLKHRNLRPLQEWFEWADTHPLVQEFISGKPAHRAVFCVNGEVLAGTSVVAHETCGQIGSANVVEVIDNKKMDEVAKVLAHHFGSSGFSGFDFILGDDGNTYLLELNPRHINTANLAFAGRKSPVVALCTHLLGREIPEMDVITKPIVAFSPHGQKRVLRKKFGARKIHFYTLPNIHELITTHRNWLRREEEKEAVWDAFYKKLSSSKQHIRSLIRPLQKGLGK